MKSANILFYTTPTQKINIDVRLHDETLWLTQKQMAELFGTAKSTVSEHLKNIFESGELQREATVRKFRTVQKEGSREVTRTLEYYNLDAIIAVGYRVNSMKATIYLDFAENQAERGIVMTMKEWVEKLDAFLDFNGYEILENAGKMQKKVADALAIEHYKAFRVRQDREYESDFDKLVKRTLKEKP